ncbi:tetraspanin-9-like isoform X2 [Amphiura filiformis]|uniref:tetraspanin-9-like isoform X2 n=1 Tax=Amphiura filiformis TaxID=82378 RepID=UPI003B21A419
MGVEGCAKIIKYLLFVFNLLFFISGCGILALGITLNVNNGGFATLLPSVPFLNAANLCIAVGVIVMVVGFVGCCGAIKENGCMLLIFFFLLLLIFVLEIVAGILGFVYESQVSDYVESDLITGLQKYDTEKGLQSAWDRLQSDLQCCGVDGAADWAMNSSFPATQFPDSCCREYAIDCGKTVGYTGAWKDGCAEILLTYLEDNIYYVGAVCIAIGIFELFGMIFACVLHRSIKEGEYA